MQYEDKKMTGVISGTSKGKLFRELGLQSLQQRRWYWKLLKTNLKAICLIQFPNQTVNIKQKL